ncbi:YeeE/YedE thiosulfate transporter family protein [Thermohalobacter berrensis]|uniref:YeeE/YedE thiosulfate transporter family protein n=1 Tax=Thermohalobacter berrensis TaxID=99594 RepID=UPI00242CE6BF|nr:YeeE/YedE thiosulfate transporter family protein [Thermohalobacter berrensis]
MKLYNKIMKKPWPYLIGGILLSILNIILIAKTGIPWKVTTGFLYWGAHFFESIGIDVSSWYYFQQYQADFAKGENFIINYYTFLNIAVILGALIASLLSSEFTIKKIKNKKAIIFRPFRWNIDGLRFKIGIWM